MSKKAFKKQSFKQNKWYFCKVVYESMIKRHTTSSLNAMRV